MHIDADGDTQDIVPIFLPMFHIYGMVTAMLSMLTGGCKLVTVPKFGTKELLQVLKEYRPTIMNIVPPVGTFFSILLIPFINTLLHSLPVNLINKNPDVTSELLASVRIISCGAAPLGASDVQQFNAKTNGKGVLVQGYGMTEASPVVSFQSTVMANGVKDGGIGFLVPNTEAKIVDAHGKTLAANESGELYVRGPQVMKGYLKNDAATKESITEDGFLKTGDIVYYDEDQHFFLQDRLKELIKVNCNEKTPPIFNTTHQIFR